MRARQGLSTITSMSVASAVREMKGRTSVALMAQFPELRVWLRGNLVWDERYDGLSNTLEVHVMELRRKLEAFGPRLLHTVRGRGYVFGERAGDHR